MKRCNPSPTMAVVKQSLVITIVLIIKLVSAAPVPEKEEIDGTCCPGGVGGENIVFEDFYRNQFALVDNCCSDSEDLDSGDSYTFKRCNENQLVLVQQCDPCGCDIDPCDPCQCDPCGQGNAGGKTINIDNCDGNQVCLWNDDCSDNTSPDTYTIRGCDDNQFMYFKGCDPCECDQCQNDPCCQGSEGSKTITIEDCNGNQVCLWNDGCSDNTPNTYNIKDCNNNNFVVYKKCDPNCPDTTDSDINYENCRDNNVFVYEDCSSCSSDGVGSNVSILEDDNGNRIVVYKDCGFSCPACGRGTDTCEATECEDQSTTFVDDYRPRCPDNFGGTTYDSTLTGSHYSMRVLPDRNIGGDYGRQEQYLINGNQACVVPWYYDAGGFSGEDCGGCFWPSSCLDFCEVYPFPDCPCSPPPPECPEMDARPCIGDIGYCSCCNPPVIDCCTYDVSVNNCDCGCCNSACSSCPSQLLGCTGYSKCVCFFEKGSSSSGQCCDCGCPPKNPPSRYHPRRLHDDPPLSDDE